MAINFMEKHAALIDEAFTAASVTDRAVNKDYEFVGVRTVKVHSVPTVKLNDYTPSGTYRYGTPAELEDNVQELTLGPDRAFTFTVDKGNSDDDTALNEGAALRRQIEQEVVPEVDMYRFARMAAGAKHVRYGAYKGSGNTGAYERLLDLNADVDDAKVPAEGRLAYVTSAFYKALKLDPNFIKPSEMAQGMLQKGQIGEVDGLQVYKDNKRMPAGVDAMIVHPKATTAPWKLSDYKTHKDPPGINGVLVEGRNRYDAFVLDQKRGALAVHRGSKLKLEPDNVEGTATGATQFTAVGGATVLDGNAAVRMGTLCYAFSGSNIAALEIGTDIKDTTAFPELTLGVDLTCDASAKYRVYLKDQNGMLIGESEQGTVKRK